jgi:hypothetical protein
LPPQPTPHHHAPGTTQPLGWSLLRLAMPIRLGAACLIAAALWALVLLAMR